MGMHWHLKDTLCPNREITCSLDLSRWVAPQWVAEHAHGTGDLWVIGGVAKEVCWLPGGQIVI